MCAGGGTITGSSPLHGMRSSISAPETLLRDAAIRISGSCSDLAPAPGLARTNFGAGFLAYAQSQNVFGEPSTPAPGARPRSPVWPMPSALSRLLHKARRAQQQAGISKISMALQHFR